MTEKKIKKEDGLKRRRTKASGDKSSENNEKAVKKPTKIRFLLIFAVVALITVIVYAIIANSYPDYVGEYISKPDKNDSHFLFTIDVGTVRDMDDLSDTGYMTVGNIQVSLKKDGRIINITKTGYTSPVSKRAGKNYIVFERSTGKYSIMNKKGSVYSSQTDSEIINADISESGCYIIITRKTLSSSLVTVYSKKNAVLFQWECNETYLTNCAISPNGKNFAVASFDVKNGEQTSTIFTFNTKSVRVEREINCGNDTIFAMRYLNGNSIGLVTDKHYIVANDSSGEKTETSYGYDSIAGYYFGANNNVAVLKSYFGTLDKSTLTVFDKSANEIFSTEINEKVIDFCIDKSFVYVMTSGKIYVYSISGGDEYACIDTVGGLKYMTVISEKIFCSSDTDVYRYEK